MSQAEPLLLTEPVKNHWLGELIRAEPMSRSKITGSASSTKYDPIGLFEKSLVFVLISRLFKKVGFLMLQLNFKLLIFGYRNRCLTKFFNRSKVFLDGELIARIALHENAYMTLIQEKTI
jgi:hypothetical protein